MYMQYFKKKSLFVKKENEKMIHCMIVGRPSWAEINFSKTKKLQNKKNAKPKTGKT